VPDEGETTKKEDEKSEPKPVPAARTLPKPMTRPELEALRKKLQAKFHS
jgi:hypothetical protein